MVAARARFLRHETVNFGTPPQEDRGQLIISNHISWLDIMVVNGAFRPFCG